MPADAFQVPVYLDYPATFLWAASGALLAARRGYDVAGILVIAGVSAAGGGLIRDGIFLQGAPPVLVRTPVYLELIAAAALLVLLLGRYVQRLRLFDLLVRLSDAAGLGAYAVVGMQLAASKGLSPLSMCLIGVVNAVGGGVLRDVLMRQEPEIFQPGTLTALAALAGCVTYLALANGLSVHPAAAGWAAIGVTFAVRSASVRFGLKTRPVPGLYAPPDPPSA